MDTISGWHGDHMRFTRLLDSLEHEMTAFDAGEEPNYELMRDVLYYLHHFADRNHHPREDAAFERLALRDPGFRVRVNRLRQEHRALALSGKSLLKLLEEKVEGAGTDPAIIEAAAALYLGYFRHHLDAEEDEVLPRAAKILTPEDWAAVAAVLPAIPDPLSGEDVTARYRSLREWVRQRA